MVLPEGEKVRTCFAWASDRLARGSSAGSQDKAHYRLCMTVLNAYSVSSETEAQVNERSTLSLQRFPPSEQIRTGRSVLTGCL
jgi:hypothetical protein